MDHRERYFFPLARKLSSRLGKPSAIIVAVAFLFVWAIIALIVGLPTIVYLVINIAVSGVIFLMVVIVQNAHERDVLALQARIEELAAERRRDSQPSPDALTETELQQLRDLLRRSDDDDFRRRSDRDKRPSLF